MTDTNTPHGIDVPTRDELEALISIGQANLDGGDHYHTGDVLFYTKAIAALRALSEERERINKETVTLAGFDYDFEEWVYEVSEGNIDFGSPLYNSTFNKFARWREVQNIFEREQGICPDEAEFFTSCAWLENVPVTKSQISNEEAHPGAEPGDDYWHTTTLGYSMSVIGDAALCMEFHRAAIRPAPSAETTTKEAP